MAALLAVIAFCLAAPRALSFLPSVVALAGLAFVKIRYKTFPPLDKSLALFFLAVTVLAGASALWAPDTAYAFERSLKIAGILFPLLALFAMAKIFPKNVLHKSRLMDAAFYICTITGIILFIEYFTKFSMTREILSLEYEDLSAGMRNGFLLNRSAVFLVMILLSVIFMLLYSKASKNKKILQCGVLFLAVGACLYATQSQTAQMAAVFAAIMMVYPSHRKKARRILLAAILILIAAAPFLSAPTYKLIVTEETALQKDSMVMEASVPHRLEVWQFASEKIMEKPLLGHGVDAMRFLKSDYMMAYMNADNVLHPHNAVLQLWLEFGLAGVVLMIAFVAILFARIEKMPPLFQRYHTMLFVVTLGVLTTGYGLWQAWLLGMIGMVVAMSIMATRMNSSDQN